MCTHKNTIEDFSTGDVICTDCGLILDAIFLHEPNKKQIDPILYNCKENNNLKIGNLKNQIKDFIILLNIHDSFIDNIVNNVKKLLIRFSHFSITLCIAAGIFVILSESEINITLTKLENIVAQNKRDKRNLFKMIVSIQQRNIKNNISENIADSILHGLDLTFSDIKSIKKNIVQLRCDYCTYNPLTVIASHTFLYMKEKKLSTKLGNICGVIGISKNSVYSYINVKKHKCVKAWYHVYK